MDGWMDLARKFWYIDAGKAETLIFYFYFIGDGPVRSSRLDLISKVVKYLSWWKRFNS